MKRLLMILTSHRLDCLKLNFALLKATDSFTRFDRVVLMLNGVVGRHRRFIERFMTENPLVPWEIISGPRGKGPLVANLQNECVRRYPDHLFFKIDEDVFVSDGWVEKLAAAYEAFKHDDNLALITPVIPNNGLGWHHLLNHFPDLADEYRSTFSHPIVPDCNGPVWIYPQIAEWISRKFLNLEEANMRLCVSSDQVSGVRCPGFAWKLPPSPRLRRTRRRGKQVSGTEPPISHPESPTPPQAALQPSTCNLQPATSSPHHPNSPPPHSS